MPITKFLLNQILLDILYRLRKPHYVTELVNKSKRSSPLVQVYLIALEDQGFVRTMRISHRKYYMLNEKGKRLLQLIEEIDKL